MTTTSQMAAMSTKRLSDPALAALRFLGACPWSSHPWWSVQAGLKLQLTDKHKNANANVFLKALKHRGLVEDNNERSPGYTYWKITPAGLGHLRELARAP